MITAMTTSSHTDKLIIIGSRALQIRAPGLLDREPMDWDFLTTPDGARSWIQGSGFEPCFGKHGYNVTVPPSGGTPAVEIEIVEPGLSSEDLYHAIATDPETVTGDGVLIPSLNALFAIKTSHRYLKNSPHFWKTLGDWHRLRAAGAKITSRYKSVVLKRSKETYTYTHPTLMGAKKGTFFTPNVEYVYDHDTVHQAVARSDRPAYTYYMVDGAEVECDRDKFFSLPEEIRVNGALEEAAVLAVERSLVPFPGGMEPRQAWLYAFSKVCTSITSGWFRQWCFENAPLVLEKSADYPFWEMFQKGLASGIVKPHQWAA